MIIIHILNQEVDKMSTIKGLNSIKDVLRASVGSSLPVIFAGGRKVVIRVVAVEDDMLVAAVRCKIVTINICCICAVVINCETLLRFLLKDTSKRHEERENDFLGGSRSRSRSLLEGDENDFVI